jgi:SAM-dependent methyltransferase
MDEITHKLERHYRECFAVHGATPKGVDWRDDETADIRYGRMLAVVEATAGEIPTVLDVGCGYGGLLGYARKNNVALSYIGIDVVTDMIEQAGRAYPDARFMHGDVMTATLDTPVDYVVCNGILTQKLDASIPAMDAFAQRLIVRMFSMARCGIAFNMMSSFVNFTVPNLFYKDPAETLTFCLSNLSRHVKIDHSYGLYEYTTYAYHEQVA